MQTTQASVAMVTDYNLPCNGHAKSEKEHSDYAVVFEAHNEKEFTSALRSHFLQAIVLPDINPQGMDGYKTALWIKKHYPGTKVLAFSIFNNERSIIRMMKHEARVHILNNVDPVEFKQVLDSMAQKGFYYSELVTGKPTLATGNFDYSGEPAQEGMRLQAKLNQRELQFLQLVCTELTYREIAVRMFLSPRTIDGYRDDLFEKLSVKTRVGLAMYAIKNGIVTL